MSSLKQLTEDTTDRQDGRKLAHFKSYSFFVFHQPFLPLSASRLHKTCLKTLEDKADSYKQLNFGFYNIAEDQTMKGLMDLKLAGQESMINLNQLLAAAASFNIDTSNMPVILIDKDPTADLAIFSGWNSIQQLPFSEIEFSQMQGLGKKWIQSASQKIDLWRSLLTLKEDGRLERLEGRQFKAVPLQGLVFEELFLSHLSLGYHATLSKKYQKRRTKSKSNNCLYGWERFKNFCCLGSSNMKQSTGVVNISFIDQRGEQQEILKHLREYDGSQESELEASRVVRSDSGIYSLLITNIDRFHGTKLDNIGSKPGDGQIEVVLFEGVKKWRKIGSVSGEVILRIDSECIDLQIGQRVYRCWGARELKVKQCSRVKIGISRSVLSC